MFKRNALSLALLITLTTSAFASPEKGGGNGPGNGGDAFVGAEFYTIANRLITNPAVSRYGVEEYLKRNLQIYPMANPLTYEGSSVDALSFEGQPPKTKIYTSNWAMMGCLSKYRLVLHELFVLKRVEPTLSYTVSAAIVDQMDRSNLDCRGIGEDLARIKMEQIKAWFINTPGLTVPKEGGGRSFISGGMTPESHTMMMELWAAKFVTPGLRASLKQSPLEKEMRACFFNIYSGETGWDTYFSRLASGDFPPSVDQFARTTSAYCYSNRVTRNSLTAIDILNATQAALGMSDFYDSGTFGLKSTKMRKLKAGGISNAEWTALSENILKESNGRCTVSGERLQSEYVKNGGEKMKGVSFIQMLVQICE